MIMKRNIIKKLNKTSLSGICILLLMASTSVPLIVSADAQDIINEVYPCIFQGSINDASKMITVHGDTYGEGNLVVSEKSNGEDTGEKLSQTISGIYYLRDDDPPGENNRNDVGSLLKEAPSENETTFCDWFVLFHFAEEGVYSGINTVSNIYYHFWQESTGLTEFEIGYSTSNKFGVDVNESIFITTNDYVSFVDNYKSYQL